MDLRGIPKTKESIEKLNTIISTTDSLDERLEASFYLAEIYKDIEEYSESVNTLYQFINNDIRKKYNDYYHKCLDFLIDIFVETANYDDAIKMLIKKRDDMHVLEIYKANIRIVDIFILDGRMNDAINLSIKLLNDDIDEKSKYKLYKILIKYYIDNKCYTDALSCIEKLKASSYNIDDDTYYYALYYEAYLRFNFGEYKTSYEKNKEVMSNTMFISEDLLLKAYILDIKCSTKLREFKKAILRESEYESIIDESTYENKKEFYTACLELYTDFKSKASYDNYDKKLKDLIEPVVIKKTISKKEINVIKKEIKPVSNDSYYVISNMLKLYETILLKPFNFKLRDTIIDVLKETNKLVEFDVCVIINLDKKQTDYYFKKERLYENKFSDIRQSVVYECIKDKTEHLYPTASDLKGLRDPYLNEVYEYTDIKSLFAYPIIEKGDVKAVIYYYAFSEKLALGTSYELLKLSTLLVSDRLFNLVKNDELNNQKNLFKNIFDNVNVPLKYMINDVFYLNGTATKLLEINDEISTNEYMLQISSEGYKEYKKFLESTDIEIKYNYKEKYIKETKSKIKDVSIFVLSDITNEKNYEIRQNELIYLDRETGLKNKNAYLQDIKDFISYEKFSMLYISINTLNRIKDCYGIDYAFQVIRDTSYKLKEYFKTDYIYYFKEEFLVLVQDINDLRTIQNMCLELIDFLKLKVNRKESRIEARYSVGALRYKVQTLNKDPNTLLDYVGFALKTANLSENSFAYFDNDKYREAFILTDYSAHINEAIDTNKIDVNYNQVIDTKTKYTVFYEIKPFINHLNVSSDDIYRIINLRGLTIKFEKFIIRKTIKELLNIYSLKNKYIRISISISYETVLSSDFVPFMKDLIKNYKIPKTLIVFDLYGKRKNVAKQIDELNIYGIQFTTSKIEDCLTCNINYFKVSYILPYLNSQKGVQTLNALKSMTEELQTKLIITNIETKDLPMLEAYKVDYASYGKSITISDIIKRME